MHFFTIYIIPLSCETEYTILHAGSCTANYNDCCTYSRLRTCQVGDCYCDSNCYQLNDCCSDLPQICTPRK